MVWETCARCGEEYPPMVTSWLCPTCDVDDYEKKMVIFDLKADD